MSGAGVQAQSEARYSAPKSMGSAVRWLRCLAWLVLAVAPAWAFAEDLEFNAPASPNDPAAASVMRDLAERVLPVYQEADPDRYLANLSALQMIAGDYGPAQVSRTSLRDRRRRADSGRPVGRGAIYDIYAHAKALEAEDRIAFADAFTKAYHDAVPRLSDHDAYAVTRWLETPPDAFAQSLQQLLDEQRTRDTINESQAVKLIWAYLAFDAYRAFAPLVGHLDAEDDARRYIVDQQVLIKLPGRPGIRATVIRPRSPVPGAPGRAAGAPSGAGAGAGARAGAGTDTPARLAALLELAIDPARNDAKEYAANGYVGVSASIERGRARPFVPYQNDGAEARAAIDWIAKQPWSDGRVAMVGEGYSGFTAWAAAAHAPAALKAIATSSPTAPGIDVPMSGNIFQNSAYRWSLWAANTKPSLDASFEDDAVWRALNEKWYRSGRPYRDFGSLHGTPDPIFLRWLNHPSYDRFWQTMIPFQEQFAHLDIPVLTLTGYFAESEPAALYYFSQHQQYNPHADHTLLIGPYEEGALERGPAPQLHGYEVDPVALIDLRQLEYQWLDHVLKGAALPPQLGGRINYEVMGANEWRHAASLDAMAGGSQRLYLDAAPAGDAHRLGRRKSAKSAAIHQTISFTDRSDAGWMPPTDLISKSLVTHDAVMFVGEPLSNPMELSGLISGRLDFVVNKMDLDVNIAIYEQLANGDYVRLSSPAFELRLSYAADRVHRHLLKAGERQQVSFKSERITSRQLGKGSRLVMILRISKRPDREIDYGTGNDVSEESVADGKVPLKVRWYNDSYIEIPARAVAQTAR